MFVIDQIILLAAILIIFGIVSSKLSARLGLPVLVLFLMVGMLAGEDGPGGIVFDNAEIAHALGSLALAIILFDGGLQTPMISVRQVWKPASVLATFGVLVTAIITGVAAAYILDLSLFYGLLIGAIVGSTDAAAVFSLLRNAGIHINPRLKATLEIESATNDPMAIFLTVGLLEVLVKGLEPGTGLLMLFVQQMGIGSVVGLAAGWLSVRIINRIHLTTSGLYPVMVAAFGLLAFGVAANLGGSGFLAIFIAGVVIGNSRFVFQRSTFLFHDGLAWLGQIIMFVILGLLINPSTLLDVWFEGLLIALVLTLLARPLSVLPVLKLFGFSMREITLVSWVGLRGSVPIILAIYPLMYGLPGAELIFSVVFFVVLISATVQGSTLPLMARALGLTEPAPATPAATLEITALGDVDADIVEYQLGDSSRASGRRLSQMALPDGTVVAMITRGNEVIPPRGSTFLLAGDHLFIVMKPEVRDFVDLVCSGIAKSNYLHLPAGELKLKGYTKVEDLSHSYGIALSADGHLSLDEVLRQALAESLAVGASKNFGEVTLYVREMVGQRITTVGIAPTSNASQT
ncbi:MAG: potassium/proton antiporter [Gammaproteobacteria bacterium]|nr:potassium/proton antiporter [Gammaproteobacteria bacterium]MBU2056666.1 potassium/proton antiporter [Gammaproteobacteria bacterium]MBU2174003.1 potassium/proton antiporter [Gammaproteobacteria bacterium]MBU2247309.1 potassium/proton antiporter [Gammaproteobacteria bacterium]MBU2345013.1 potassium/proton antiporter [Gammaproteobacteria bacterium]